MMTIQPQIKLAIGVILTNPTPPQLLFFITQSNEKNLGKMPTCWATLKFPAAMKKPLSTQGLY